MRVALTMALIAGVTMAGAGCSSHSGADPSHQLSGAGATFPYPVYARWAFAYQKKTGVRLNYQAIGSGAGIRQIKAGTVDFGASDTPVKKTKLDQYGLMQFPMIVGGVVPVVHIAGIKPGQLRLDSKTLVDIYLGRISRWNDPRIKKLNPALNLPDEPVTVVYRSDGSGTTWIFTSYLTQVSPAWAQEVGHAKAVAWPTGLGGKGNQGVAAYVKRVKGAIGYVEYTYAAQNHMTYVALRNRAGHFVQPAQNAFATAASHADWKNAPGFYVNLTNQPGAKSWPISAASFILMHKTQSHSRKGRVALLFFDWAYNSGDKLAQKLDYVPLPPKVVNLVEKAWHREIHGPHGQSIWNPSSPTGS